MAIPPIEKPAPKLSAPEAVPPSTQDQLNKLRADVVAMREGQKDLPSAEDEKWLKAYEKAQKDLALLAAEVGPTYP